MECKIKKKEKDEECSCEKCVRKEAVLLMMFISGGFALALLGIAGYITYPIHSILSGFCGFVGVVSAFIFGFGLFYTIIHNDRYRKVDLS